MPYPGGWPFGGGVLDVFSPIAGAQIPAMAGLAVIASMPVALRFAPHFVKVAIPGHFNNLDAGCVKMLSKARGTPYTAGEVEHLNDFPAEQKEAFRLSLVNAVIDGKPMLIRWMLARGARRQRVAIEENPDETVVTFKQVAH